MLLELVESIKKIALDAGDEILKIYADEDSFGIELKSDDSPLTKADKGANDVIVAGLRQLSVTYPIISEEEKQVDYEVRKDYNRFWLVDPLDGTKEFIKRNGEFTVNIALIEDGMPILGVVLVPVSGEMYWATKGNGAFYQLKDDLRELKAASFSMKDKGVRVVCSRSHINDATKSFIDQLDTPETVSKGSSLKFLLMAANEAEIYPRMGPTMEWDTGAAQIVLEEAGGAVLHHETGEPLVYNKRKPAQPILYRKGQVDRWMISAVIITLNEEKKIADCIKSLTSVCDEIIVVDAESTDQTSAVAQQLGAKVYSKKWSGYGAARNYGVSQASNDWILSIDADERLNEELITTLQSLDKKIDTIHKCNRLTRYCGQWIKHGTWHPEWKEKLYHREYYQWDDRSVHERLIPIQQQAKTTRLSGLLLHVAYDTHAELQSRLDTYARLHVERRKQENQGVPLFKRMISPTYHFIRSYLWCGGFMDGSAGYRIAKALYTYHLKKW